MAIGIKADSMMLCGHRPWFNSAGSSAMDYHFRDTKEHIDFCLNHCPYPNEECRNCFGDYYGESGRRGRPPKVTEAQVDECMDTMTVSEMAKRFGCSERTVYQTRQNVLLMRRAQNRRKSKNES